MGDWNLHSINWHCRFAGQRDEIWLTKFFKFHEKNQGGLFFLRKPLFRQEWFRDLPVLNGAAYVPFNVHQGTYCFRAQLVAKRTANELKKKKNTARPIRLISESLADRIGLSFKKRPKCYRIKIYRLLVDPIYRISPITRIVFFIFILKITENIILNWINKKVNFYFTSNMPSLHPSSHSPLISARETISCHSSLLWVRRLLGEETFATSLILVFFFFHFGKRAVIFLKLLRRSFTYRTLLHSLQISSTSSSGRAAEKWSNRMPMEGSLPERATKGSMKCSRETTGFLCLTRWFISLHNSM